MNWKISSPVLSKVLVLAAAVVALQTSGCTSHSGFSAEDEVNVRGAVQQYVKAWLSNDPDAVMATLTDDIVLQPHHGGDPVVGAKAVRAWWFPKGPPTVVTSFREEIKGVAGSGSLAYAWGQSSVAWTSEGKSYSKGGNFLSILRKGKDGVWRMSHHIWNDPPNQVQ